MSKRTVYRIYDCFDGIAFPCVECCVCLGWVDLDCTELIPAKQDDDEDLHICCECAEKERAEDSQGGKIDRPQGHDMEGKR